MRMNTDALVLKTTDTGEHDRLVTLLTSDYGVIRAFANRAKKLNNKIHGATQSLCYGEFSLYRSRDSYIIDDATAKELFFDLRQEITRLSLAQYFCALAMALIPEMEPAAEQLRVLLNSLHLLETQRRSEPFLKAVTELRLLCLSGYQPDLTACPHCGRTAGDGMRFHVHEGCLFCRESGRGGEPLPPSVLAAMRHVCANPVDRIYAFAIPAEDELILARITERFLLEQTGARISALDFYHTVKS